MMRHCNISKYDRKNSDYLDDWTSIWQAIGEDFSNSKVWSDYLNIERQYLDFASAFIFNLGFDSFEVSELQSNVDSDTISEFSKIKVGLLDPEWELQIKADKESDLTFIEIISLIQLGLRGVVWFKLINRNSGEYLSFDVDYYFLIGTKQHSKVPDASEFGLYENPMNDPWI